MDPPASHGNPPPHHPSGSASQQWRDRPDPETLAPARRSAFRGSRGPAVTVALREVNGDALPPDSHPTILIIDSDGTSRESLAATLSVEGFDVVTARDGIEGIDQLRSVRPALVLLDMQLPDSQGLAVFRQISTIAPVPVIMVTSRPDELDAVLALEAGAADHITKPPRPRELTARIRAVLRRVGDPAGPAAATAAANNFTLGPVSIDLALRETVVRGEPLELSRKEFDLLALLVSQSGHVVTRKQCMEKIWRDRTKGDSRTLDTHVKRLRKKVERNPAEPEHVLTVRGIGYRFKP